MRMNTRFIERLSLLFADLDCYKAEIREEIYSRKVNEETEKKWQSFKETRKKLERMGIK